MNEQETDNNDFPFPVTDSFLVIWEFAGGMAFPGSSAGKKKSTCNAGDPGSIPGLEKSAGEDITLNTHSIIQGRMTI